MKKRMRKFWACFLVVIICFLSIDVYQADQEDTTVRVGVFEMQGFHYHDENGELRGYCIDYLNLLGRMAGWEYEFVDVSDFMNGCEMLENKEIDLLAPAVLTEERYQKFGYSEMSIGIEYTVLLTTKDRTELYYEDYTAYDGMKVAVLNEYPLTEYFISYMNMNDFQAELVYFDTVKESQEALANGQVDAMIDSIMNINDEQKILAKFTPQPIYFLVDKDNPELLQELNYVMLQVQNIYPEFLDELLKIYFPSYELQNFTREEIDYINSSDTLRVAYIDNRKPLSFTNEDGELDGISREIFDRIGELSGLNFEYVALPEEDITYEDLIEMDLDLITGVEYNNVNIKSRGVFLSRPYILSRMVMVSQGEFQYKEDAKYKVGIATGSQTLHIVLEEQYPNYEIVEYESIDMCFDALHSGELDMLLQNQFVVEYFLTKPIYSNLVVVPMDGLADELCFSPILSMNGKIAMSEEESRLIIGILNKSISQITDTELENIVVRETLENQHKMDHWEFLYQYRFSIMVMFAASVIGLILFLVYRKERKRRRQIEEAEMRHNILQQKRYKTVIDCSEDLIYEISLEGEANICSSRIKEKFGWEIPKEVRDLDFSKAMKLLHVHPDDESIFRQTILASGEGQFDEQVLRIGKADGTYIWCKVTRTILVDDNNSIVSILGKIVDIDDEVKEKKQLEIRSRTDSLTGLLNKLTFEKEVKDYLEINSSEEACFVFLDMDHFKEINDRFGHNVGDQVIKETAKKVQLLFKNFDLVSRFGGDEFCVFIKEIPRETLIDRLKFAVKKMEQEYPYEGGVVKISASIGAAYCKCDRATYKQLLETADAAAYQAKDNGRNCYIIKDIE